VRNATSSRCSPGDVPETCADIEDLAAAVGVRPMTPLDEGIRRFVA
jgi:UDP-glucuronate 4-epimerase